MHSWAVLRRSGDGFGERGDEGLTTLGAGALPSAVFGDDCFNGREIEDLTGFVSIFKIVRMC